MIISTMGYFDSVDKESYGLWFMVGVTALGCIITIFVRPKLRRYNIDKQGTT